MMENFKKLILRDEEIRREADEILDAKGLRELLGRYGTPHVTGSYVLQLMTWHDLDIYLENDSLTEADFFALGGQIASSLKPGRMQFRNTHVLPIDDAPKGLYWGIHLGDPRHGDWKIDIWAVDSKKCRELLAYCDIIEAKLTSKIRLYILDIKSQCWQHPEYRKSFTSQDIYRAVLDDGITDIKSFRKYMQISKNILIQ